MEDRTVGTTTGRLTTRALLAVVVAGVLLTGVACGTLRSRENAAIAAARDFRFAVATHDASAACALMAPQTRRELRQTTKQPCVRGVGAVEIPAGRDRDDVRRVDVFGGQARVEFAGDTVFLAEFPTGWRVSAAGCTPRGDHPYDCTLAGL